MESKLSSSISSYYNAILIQREEWNKAMNNDGDSISRLLFSDKFLSAERRGLKGEAMIFDIQESITMWYAARMRTNRQPSSLICIAEKTIPNRLDYLDKVLGKYFFLISLLS